MTIELETLPYSYPSISSQMAQNTDPKQRGFYSSLINTLVQAFQFIAKVVNNNFSVVAGQVDVIQAASRARMVATTGVVSLTTGVWTKITFDTTTFDTNTEFASSRFTAKVAGYHLVSTRFFVPTGFAAEAIYKNGAVYSQGGAAGAGEIIVGHTDTVFLAVNDFVELFGMQNSGSTHNSGASGLTSLTVDRLP
jgi:hypothetical protein